MGGLRLEIVTPDKVVLEADVDYVGASGVDGAFGVLPGHIPLLSALAVGELYYRQGDSTHWVFVGGGFSEVSDGKVTVLAESAEMSSDIDAERARRALERARKRLDGNEPDTDHARAAAALHRALHRLHAAGR
jgi:F-type H+-transporting ATPase subunit epsilon